MRRQESEEIRRVLAAPTINPIARFATVVNLGSGDTRHLARTKPWVAGNVFAPLAASGACIVHADMDRIAGVDRVIDLGEPATLGFIAECEAPRLLILANVLEHVPRAARARIAANVAAAMSPGDALVVTVPNDYPYHPDPIDTMFRPSPGELQRLMPLDWRYGGVVDCGSYRDEIAAMAWPKKLRKLTKPLWPFQYPRRYLSEAHRLAYLFRRYRTTVAFGIR